MFEKILSAIEEIEKLKEEHKLYPEEIFVLRMLKFSEIYNVDYETMNNYFINCKNCETKGRMPRLKMG